jgi:hypothetical protein
VCAHHLQTVLITAVLVPNLSNEPLSSANVNSAFLRQSVQPHLNQTTIKSLLKNSAIQSLLKYEDYQDLIRGICLLESISDITACLFLHLRSNPCLCERDAISAGRSEAILAVQQEPAPLKNQESTTQGSLFGS